MIECFSADVAPDEKLAVMVFIHGGAFASGSGNDLNLGPDFLLEQRVIVVTFNYRLNIFGFLSFGTPEYSGNMGLKDQQLALKWIHSNSEHFSGDNKRITLFGVSAGSVAAHFQILSAESRKYFRNAILMSGVVDLYWAVNKRGDNLDLALKITEELDGPKQSASELIEFFKSVPAKKIREYGSRSGFYKRTLQSDFGPVIESKRNNFENIFELI